MKKTLDTENVAYNLGQAVNLLECLTDYFDEMDTAILKLHQGDARVNAEILAASVAIHQERWKTLIFDARDGVQKQIDVLEGGE